MPRHTVSHADEIFVGNGVKAGINENKRGLPWTPIQQISLGAPDALDLNGYVAAAAVAGAGAVALNGALVTAGVGQSGANYGRGVVVDSSNAGDTTQVVTVTGTDALDEPVVEDITLNGTTAVNGQKAFKTVTGVSVSAAMTGTLDVGTTDILGLPYRLDGVYDLLHAFADTADERATGTLAAADTTDPATATTNDPRGTWLPATATDGSVVYRLWYKISGLATNKQAFGVDNFAG